MQSLLIGGNLGWRSKAALCLLAAFSWLAAAPAAAQQASMTALYEQTTLRTDGSAAPIVSFIVANPAGQTQNVILEGVRVEINAEEGVLMSELELRLDVGGVTPTVGVADSGAEVFEIAMETTLAPGSTGTYILNAKYITPVGVKEGARFTTLVREILLRFEPSSGTLALGDLEHTPAGGGAVRVDVRAVAVEALVRTPGVCGRPARRIIPGDHTLSCGGDAHLHLDGIRYLDAYGNEDFEPRAYSVVLVNAENGRRRTIAVGADQRIPVHRNLRGVADRGALDLQISSPQLRMANIRIGIDFEDNVAEVSTPTFAAPAPRHRQLVAIGDIAIALRNTYTNTHDADDALLRVTLEADCATEGAGGAAADGCSAAESLFEGTSVLFNDGDAFSAELTILAGDGAATISGVGMRPAVDWPALQSVGETAASLTLRARVYRQTDNRLLGEAVSAPIAVRTQAATVTLRLRGDGGNLLEAEAPGARPICVVAEPFNPFGQPPLQVVVGADADASQATEGLDYAWRGATTMTIVAGAAAPAECPTLEILDDDLAEDAFEHLRLRIVSARYPSAAAVALRLDATPLLFEIVDDDQAPTPLTATATVSVSYENPTLRTDGLRVTLAAITIHNPPRVSSDSRYQPQSLVVERLSVRLEAAAGVQMSDLELRTDRGVQTTAGMIDVGVEIFEVALALTVAPDSTETFALTAVYNTPTGVVDNTSFTVSGVALEARAEPAPAVNVELRVLGGVEHLPAGGGVVRVDVAATQTEAGVKTAAACGTEARTPVFGDRTLTCGADAYFTVETLRYLDEYGNEDAAQLDFTARLVNDVAGWRRPVPVVGGNRIPVHRHLDGVADKSLLRLDIRPSGGVYPIRPASVSFEADFKNTSATLAKPRFAADLRHRMGTMLEDMTLSLINTYTNTHDADPSLLLLVLNGDCRTVGRAGMTVNGCGGGEFSWSGGRSDAESSVGRFQDAFNFTEPDGDGEFSLSGVQIRPRLDWPALQSIGVVDAQLRVRAQIYRRDDDAGALLPALAYRRLAEAVSEPVSVPGQAPELAYSVSGNDAAIVDSVANVGAANRVKIADIRLSDGGFDTRGARVTGIAIVVRGADSRLVFELSADGGAALVYPLSLADGGVVEIDLHAHIRPDQVGGLVDGDTVEARLEIQAAASQGAEVFSLPSPSSPTIFAAYQVTQAADLSYSVAARRALRVDPLNNVGEANQIKVADIRLSDAGVDRLGGRITSITVAVESGDAPLNFILSADGGAALVYPLLLADGGGVEIDLRAYIPPQRAADVVDGEVIGLRLNILASASDADGDPLSTTNPNPPLIEVRTAAYSPLDGDRNGVPDDLELPAPYADLAAYLSDQCRAPFTADTLHRADCDGDGVPDAVELHFGPADEVDLSPVELGCFANGLRTRLSRVLPLLRCVPAGAVDAIGRETLLHVADNGDARIDVASPEVLGDRTYYSGRYWLSNGAPDSVVRLDITPAVDISAPDLIAENRMLPMRLRELGPRPGSSEPRPFYFFNLVIGSQTPFLDLINAPPSSLRPGEALILRKNYDLGGFGLGDGAEIIFAGFAGGRELLHDLILLPAATSASNSVALALSTMTLSSSNDADSLVGEVLTLSSAAATPTLLVSRPAGVAAGGDRWQLTLVSADSTAIAVRGARAAPLPGVRFDAATLRLPLARLNLPSLPARLLISWKRDDGEARYGAHAVVLIVAADSSPTAAALRGYDLIGHYRDGDLRYDVTPEADVKIRLGDYAARRCLAESAACGADADQGLRLDDAHEACPRLSAGALPCLDFQLFCDRAANPNCMKRAAADMVLPLTQPLRAEQWLYLSLPDGDGGHRTCPFVQTEMPAHVEPVAGCPGVDATTATFSARPLLDRIHVALNSDADACPPIGAGEWTSLVELQNGLGAQEIDWSTAEANCLRVAFGDDGPNDSADGAAALIAGRMAVRSRRDGVSPSACVGAVDHIDDLPLDEEARAAAQADCLRVVGAPGAYSIRLEWDAARDRREAASGILTALDNRAYRVYLAERDSGACPTPARAPLRQSLDDEAGGAVPALAANRRPPGYPLAAAAVRGLGTTLTEFVVAGTTPPATRPLKSGTRYCLLLGVSDGVWMDWAPAIEVRTQPYLPQQDANMNEVPDALETQRSYDDLLDYMSDLCNATLTVDNLRQVTCDDDLVPDLVEMRFARPADIRIAPMELNCRANSLRTRLATALPSLTCSGTDAAAIVETIDAQTLVHIADNNVAADEPGGVRLSVTNTDALGDELFYSGRYWLSGDTPDSVVVLKLDPAADFAADLDADLNVRVEVRALGPRPREVLFSRRLHFAMSLRHPVSEAVIDLPALTGNERIISIDTPLNGGEIAEGAAAFNIGHGNLAGLDEVTLRLQWDDSLGLGVLTRRLSLRQAASTPHFTALRLPAPTLSSGADSLLDGALLLSSSASTSTLIVDRPAGAAAGGDAWSLSLIGAEATTPALRVSPPTSWAGARLDQARLELPLAALNLSPSSLPARLLLGWSGGPDGARRAANTVILIAAADSSPTAAAARALRGYDLDGYYRVGGVLRDVTPQPGVKIRLGDVGAQRCLMEPAACGGRAEGSDRGLRLSDGGRVCPSLDAPASPCVDFQLAWDAGRRDAVDVVLPLDRPLQGNHWLYRSQPGADGGRLTCPFAQNGMPAHVAAIAGCPGVDAARAPPAFDVEPTHPDRIYAAPNSDAGACPTSAAPVWRPLAELQNQQPLVDWSTAGVNCLRVVYADNGLNDSGDMATAVIAEATAVGGLDIGVSPSACVGAAGSVDELSYSDDAARDVAQAGCLRLVGAAEAYAFTLEWDAGRDRRRYDDPTLVALGNRRPYRIYLAERPSGVCPTPARPPLRQSDNGAAGGAVPVLADDQRPAGYPLAATSVDGLSATIFEVSDGATTALLKADTRYCAVLGVSDGVWMDWAPAIEVRTGRYSTRDSDMNGVPDDLEAGGAFRDLADYLAGRCGAALTSEALGEADCDGDGTPDVVELRFGRADQIALDPTTLTCRANGRRTRLAGDLPALSCLGSAKTIDAIGAHTRVAGAGVSAAVTSPETLGDKTYLSGRYWLSGDGADSVVRLDLEPAVDFAAPELVHATATLSVRVRMLGASPAAAAVRRFDVLLFGAVGQSDLGTIDMRLSEGLDYFEAQGRYGLSGYDLGSAPTLIVGWQDGVGFGILRQSLIVPGVTTLTAATVADVRTSSLPTPVLSAGDGSLVDGVLRLASTASMPTLEFSRPAGIEAGGDRWRLSLAAAGATAIERWSPQAPLAGVRFDQSALRLPLSALNLPGLLPARLLISWSGDDGETSYGAHQAMVIVSDDPPAAAAATALRGYPLLGHYHTEAHGFEHVHEVRPEPGVQVRLGHHAAQRCLAEPGVCSGLGESSDRGLRLTRPGDARHPSCPQLGVTSLPCLDLQLFCDARSGAQCMRRAAVDVVLPLDEPLQANQWLYHSLPRAEGGYRTCPFVQADMPAHVAAAEGCPGVDARGAAPVFEDARALHLDRIYVALDSHPDACPPINHISWRHLAPLQSPDSGVDWSTAEAHCLRVAYADGGFNDAAGDETALITGVTAVGHLDGVSPSACVGAVSTATALSYYGDDAARDAAQAGCLRLAGAPGAYELTLEWDAARDRRLATMAELAALGNARPYRVYLAERASGACETPSRPPLAQSENGESGGAVPALTANARPAGYPLAMPATGALMATITEAGDGATTTPLKAGTRYCALLGVSDGAWMDWAPAIELRTAEYSPRDADANGVPDDLQLGADYDDLADYLSERCGRTLDADELHLADCDRDEVPDVVEMRFARADDIRIAPLPLNCRAHTLRTRLATDLPLLECASDGSASRAAEIVVGVGARSRVHVADNRVAAVDPGGVAIDVANPEALGDGDYYSGRYWLSGDTLDSVVRLDLEPAVDWAAPELLAESTTTLSLRLRLLGPMPNRAQRSGRHLLLASFTRNGSMVSGNLGEIEVAAPLRGGQTQSVEHQLDLSAHDLSGVARLRLVLTWSDLVGVSTLEQAVRLLPSKTPASASAARALSLPAIMLSAGADSLNGEVLTLSAAASTSSLVVERPAAAGAGDRWALTLQGAGMAAPARYSDRDSPLTGVRFDGASLTLPLAALNLSGLLPARLLIDWSDAGGDHGAHRALLIVAAGSSPTTAAAQALLGYDLSAHYRDGGGRRDVTPEPGVRVRLGDHAARRCLTTPSSCGGWRQRSDLGLSLGDAHEACPRLAAPAAPCLDFQLFCSAPDCAKRVAADVVLPLARPLGSDYWLYYSLPTSGGGRLNCPFVQNGMPRWLAAKVGCPGVDAKAKPPAFDAAAVYADRIYAALGSDARACPPIGAPSWQSLSELQNRQPPIDWSTAAANCLRVAFSDNGPNDLIADAVRLGAGAVSIGGLAPRRVERLLLSEAGSAESSSSLSLSRRQDVAGQSLSFNFRLTALDMDGFATPLHLSSSNLSVEAIVGGALTDYELTPALEMGRAATLTLTITPIAQTDAVVVLRVTAGELSAEARIDVEAAPASLAVSFAQSEMRFNEADDKVTICVRLAANLAAPAAIRATLAVDVSSTATATEEEDYTLTRPQARLAVGETLSGDCADFRLNDDHRAENTETLRLRIASVAYEDAAGPLPPLFASTPTLLVRIDDDGDRIHVRLESETTTLMERPLGASVAAAGLVRLSLWDDLNADPYYDDLGGQRAIRLSADDIEATIGGALALCPDDLQALVAAGHDACLRAPAGVDWRLEFDDNGRFLHLVYERDGDHAFQAEIVAVDDGVVEGAERFSVSTPRRPVLDDVYTNVGNVRQTLEFTLSDPPLADRLILRAATETLTQRAPGEAVTALFSLRVVDAGGADLLRAVTVSLTAGVTGGATLTLPSAVEVGVGGAEVAVSLRPANGVDAVLTLVAHLAGVPQTTAQVAVLAAEGLRVDFAQSEIRVSEDDASATSICARLETGVTAPAAIVATIAVEASATTAADEDYTLATTEMRLAAGETIGGGCAELRLIDDHRAENTEILSLRIASAAYEGAAGSLTPLFASARTLPVRIADDGDRIHVRIDSESLELNERRLVGGRVAAAGVVRISLWDDLNADPYYDDLGGRHSLLLGVNAGFGASVLAEGAVCPDDLQTLIDGVMMCVCARRREPIGDLRTARRAAASNPCL